MLQFTLLNLPRLGPRLAITLDFVLPAWLQARQAAPETDLSWTG